MRNDEIAAAQAYVRLLEATRAALADPDDGPLYVPLLASPIAEADGALRRAGLSGNESRLFDLVSSLRPGMPGGAR
ncbi:hypothetical protein ACFVWY_28405 [Streptomyces sp. NPDC058195]|uniref:hypothetical protein n=1 Tax=Streptomyces sp. NPDC058195 TaxID=3346375 RepID=UPI0036E423D5